MTVICQMITVGKSQSVQIHIPSSCNRDSIRILENGYADIFIGKNEKLELEACLGEAGASLRIFGFLSGRAAEEQEFILRIYQDAPHTTAHVTFREALRDHASSRFDALIRMGENAKGAVGKLSYRALLLSEGARAKPIPRMEILTKEVASAGHEATVGKIDPLQLFYMQSRGLSRAEAEDLIVEGFLKIAR